MYLNARAIIERTTAEGTEILLQTRDKPGEPARLELPGGQVEPYESLIDAVRREVHEETGLEVVEIEGESLRVVDAGTGTRVECVRPFAAYQTLEGPVASMGVYFRCVTAGRELAVGDGSRDAHWITPTELSARLDDRPEQFSWVDRAGLRSYVAEALRG